MEDGEPGEGEGLRLKPRDELREVESAHAHKLKEEIVWVKSWQFDRCSVELAYLLEALSGTDVHGMKRTELFLTYQLRNLSENTSHKL